MTDRYKEFGYEGDESPEDIVKWAMERYHPRIALACSFQHTVLIHMMTQIRTDARVFSVDTGRLPEETYECAQDIERRFGVKIEWMHPKTDALEEMTKEKGQFSFKESVDARHECCAIRKIEPFNRALSSLDAWISGVRRDQSGTREDSAKIERDEAHGGIIKINPLADWSYEEVTSYVKKYRLPYNRLFEQGYTSIGCACCTRPIRPGEDSRAGRWWWEGEGTKECGIHVRNWNI